MLTGGQTPCEAMNPMRAAPNAIAHGAALIKEASETGANSSGARKEASERGTNSSGARKEASERSANSRGVHKEASERGANSRGARKEASERGANSREARKEASERLNLNNTVQAKRSAVADNQRLACVSERRDIAYVPIADNHIIERE